MQYGDLEHEERSKIVREFHRIANLAVAALGVILYYAGVTLEKRTVLKIVVVVNVLLSVHMVYITNLRYSSVNDHGCDTDAYLEQAYQVWRGVTDYGKISS